MKKNYLAPTSEITSLVAEDIITSSTDPYKEDIDWDLSITQ